MSEHEVHDLQLTSDVLSREEEWLALLIELLFRRVRKIVKRRLLALSCLSVLPSFRIEQSGSYWTDFHKILYLSTFRKSVEAFKVSLKTGKNNRYFT